MEGEYSEKKPIRESFSQEFDSLPDADVDLFQKIPKRYIVAAMAFLGFCK